MRWCHADVLRYGLVAALVAGAGCASARGGPGGGGEGEFEGPGPEQRVDSSGPRYLNPLPLAALPGFTHAVKVGPYAYVSGELPLDSAGHVVGTDLAAQAKQAFSNLEVALRLAWAHPANVTRLTVYVVHLSPDDLAVIRKAAPAFFPAHNPPAGTVVGVAALPVAGALIAVDATAFIPWQAEPSRRAPMRSPLGP
jgi:enamine deaminase RidA (YjgF/YER057c/UK114 family)